MRRIKLHTRLILLFSLFMLPLGAFAQQTYTVSGKVLEPYSRKGVDVATILLPKQRIKQFAGDGGSYSIDVPAGSHEVWVRSPGYKMLKTTINVTGNMNRDFVMSPVSVKSTGYVIHDERDIQKLSRHTMDLKKLKDVPASFNDSLNALTSLPGVIRSSRSGFFGPLVIRGASPQSNAYYIDDIPVINPQHFGGIHSVISNDLMSEIDLYSSAFPAQFNQATGAIININTLDKVEKFGGTAEIGFISSNLLLKAPWTTFSSDSYAAGGGNEEKKKDDKHKGGYILAAGRVGYLSLFAPPLIELVTGDDVGQLPEYTDYQIKGKYFFNSRHAMTFLAMGSNDYLVFLDDDNSKEARLQNGGDPLFNDFDVSQQIVSNSQGLYYTYEPSSKFYNRLLLFSSLNESIFGFNAPRVSFFRDIETHARPNIFGVKNKLTFEWWKDHSELRSGQQFQYYDFRSFGTTVVPNRSIRGNFDLGEEDLFVRSKFDDEFTNESVGGYIENKFTWGGLKFVPGSRFDYINRTSQSAIDPRGLLAYEFINSRTTLSAAGGRYSLFTQTNPAWFNQQPEVAAAGEEIEPETSYHSSLGVEQKVDVWALRLEGFYNKTENILQADPNPNDPDDLGKSSGEARAYGFEVMLSKDQDTSRNLDYYGWVSYTYAHSALKTNVSKRTDPRADEYVVNQWDQRHSLKLVAGLIYGMHKFGARFQYYTSFPYTPIVGTTGPDRVYGRYQRTFGEAYSRRYPADHTLDLRYSQTYTYEWGTLTWYVEVINVYNHQPVSRQYRYDQPYKKGVNPKVEPADGLGFVPNFGVEARF